MKINITYSLFLILICFYGCGDSEKKQPKTVVLPVNKIKPIVETSNNSITADSLIESNDIILKAISKKSKIIKLPKKNSLAKNSSESNSATVGGTIKNEDKLSTFITIKKILNDSKIGQTFSQKELTENFEIPKEAIKLVKSVTRTAEDEIAIKWHSTWFIEKVSDAKFEDGLMKVEFKANKMYTSGKAIGIKYNKKIYNNLIIIGRSAYIPSVKGYHWQIGK